MPSGPSVATGRLRKRVPLTRQRVLSAALELITADGVEELSMRRLGRKLDVEAMALYRHVENKDDVLDGIVELLWRDIAASVDREGEWQDRVHTFADSVRRIARAHPNAYPLLFTRGVLPPETLELTHWLLEGLQDAGFGDRSEDAARTVMGFTSGYTMSEVLWYDQPPQADRSAGKATQESTAMADMRRVIAECDTDALFDLGLDVLLRGLADLLESGASPTTAE